METLFLPTSRKNGSETTAGRYPDNLIERKVSEWVVFCLQTRHEPPLNTPLTIHLDVLLGTGIDPVSLVSVSFETYQTLIQQMVVLNIPETIMPSLYIPLESSEVLIAGPVETAALKQQINYNEPPSLYLTDRTLEMMSWPIERYTFPLNSVDFLAEAENIDVCYQSIRTLQDIENGWEYGRSIVAEYYPEKYRYTL